MGGPGSPKSRSCTADAGPFGWTSCHRYPECGCGKSYFNEPPPPRPELADKSMTHSLESLTDLIINGKIQLKDGKTAKMSDLIKILEDIYIKKTGNIFAL